MRKKNFKGRCEKRVIPKLSELNDILDEHNLKISEYDKIMNAGHLIEQKITIVDK